MQAQKSSWPGEDRPACDGLLSELFQGPHSWSYLRNRLSNDGCCSQARLACEVDAVATKLLLLKTAFPGADAARMLTECSNLLLLDVQQFEVALQQASIKHTCCRGPTTDEVFLCFQLQLTQ
jgi:hypothetical protein